MKKPKGPSIESILQLIESAPNDKIRSFWESVLKAKGGDTGSKLKSKLKDIQKIKAKK